MPCNRLTKIYNVGKVGLTPVMCVRWATLYNRLFQEDIPVEDNVVLTFQRAPERELVATQDEQVRFTLSKPVTEEIGVQDEFTIIPNKVIYEEVATVEQLRTRVNKVIKDLATLGEVVSFGANKRLNDTATTSESQSFVFTKTLRDEVRTTSQIYVGDINLISLRSMVDIIDHLVKEVEQGGLSDLSSVTDTTTLRVFERSTTVLGEATLGNSILGVG